MQRHMINCILLNFWLVYFNKAPCLFRQKNDTFFYSPELKALCELIGGDSSRCASVRASVGLFTLSDMAISETSWWIIIKFHLKHHWGGGLAALGFGSERIITLVSMATDSSHRVIIGKSCEHSSSSMFIGSSSFLQVTRTAIKDRQD